ncbi:unnamed protein product [Prunus brigantina]
MRGFQPKISSVFCVIVLSFAGLRSLCERPGKCEARSKELRLCHIIWFQGVNWAKNTLFLYRSHWLTLSLFLARIFSASQAM